MRDDKNDKNERGEGEKEMLFISRIVEFRISLE